MSVIEAPATSLQIEFPDEEVYPISDLGSGLKLLNRRTVELTAKAAVDFLEQYLEFLVGDDKVDRVLDENHVILLEREMKAGSFLWEQVNLVICNCEGATYRLNGQHTTWARIYAEEHHSLPTGARCPVQLLKYEAATIADMRRLYASLDSAKPRSQANKIAALLLGTKDFPGYRKKDLNLLAAGLGIWKWPNLTARTIHKAQDRATLLLTEHKKIALGTGTIIREVKPADVKHIARAPVVAAMLATFDKAQQFAGDFWRAVRDGVNLADKEDPIYVLRHYLFTTTVSTVSSGTTDTKVVSQEEMFRACLHAWNAKRANRRIKHLRVTLGEERPLIR